MRSCDVLLLLGGPGWINFCFDPLESEHRPRERLCPWWRHIGHRREQVETNNVKRRRNVRIDHVISAEVGPHLLDGVVVQQFNIYRLASIWKVADNQTCQTRTSLTTHTLIMKAVIQRCLSASVVGESQALNTTDQTADLLQCLIRYSGRRDHLLDRQGSPSLGRNRARSAPKP